MVINRYIGGDPANRDVDTGRLVSALNLIVQASNARNGVRVGRNRYFFGPRQGTLGGRVDAFRGYYASCRPVWNQMMVNINVCMTAFIEPRTMAVAISEFGRGSFGAFPRLEEIFQKSNVKVRVLHLGYKKKVYAIVDKRPDQVSFRCDELGGTVTVAEYFKKSK